MRDPDRIPIILDRIGKIWEKHPELTLSQLLKEAIDYLIFFTDDEKLINKLEQYWKDRYENKT